MSDDKEMSVGEVLQKDLEKQIQGVDINDEQSFSDVIRRTENDAELEEEGKVAEKVERTS